MQYWIVSTQHVFSQGQLCLHFQAKFLLTTRVLVILEQQKWVESTALVGLQRLMPGTINEVLFSWIIIEGREDAGHGTLLHSTYVEEYLLFSFVSPMTPIDVEDWMFFWRKILSFLYPCMWVVSLVVYKILLLDIKIIINF